MEPCPFSIVSHHRLPERNLLDKLCQTLLDRGFVLEEDNPELIIVFGGDGSFLKAVHDHDGKGKYVLINTGHLGFFSDYSLEEIPAQSFWEKFFGIHDDSVFDNVEAIQRVTPEDLSSGDPATICDRLYIADADYDDFKAYYDNATKNDETVFMFRFACTDYYSAQCWEFPNDVSNSAAGGYFSGMNAYLAYMNVFLDFDIIDVTFSMDGVYTVIPVVSDPIDIFSDVTPPPVFSEGLKWWQVLLIILGIILVVYLVVKFVGWITGRTKTVKVKVRHYKK